jgi:7,8-dihydroneopterin aldolase/epimerase/oxygenase
VRFFGGITESMEESIVVSQLEVRAHVGVAPAERGAEQRLTVCLRLVPTRGLAGLGDDIANAVDYATVCAAVRQEAEGRPRRLIETLAGDIAGLLLARFPLRAVEVEVRKYILPDTEYVAVRIWRERG